MSIHNQRLDLHCDRCPARSSVEVYLGGEKADQDPDLRFCVHHYNQNEAALLAAGATIVRDNEETKVGV